MLVSLFSCAWHCTHRPGIRAILAISPFPRSQTSTKPSLFPRPPLLLAPYRPQRPFPRSLPTFGPLPARRLLFVLFYFSSARSPPFLTPVPRQRQAARLMVKWGSEKEKGKEGRKGPPSTSCALSLGGLISFFFLSAAWASLAFFSSSFCLQFPRSSPPPSGRGKEKGGERRASLLSYTRRGKRG